MLGGEPVVERGGEGDGLVELDQVAGALDQLEPGAGDEIGEAVSAVYGGSRCGLHPK